MEHDTFLHRIFWFLLGFLVGSIIIISLTQSNSNIIKHNCAHYDTITGDFTWNDKDL